MTTDAWMRIVDRFREALAAEGAPEQIVVLIGSVARGTANEQSDVDILVISEGNPHKVQSDPPAHVQYFTRTQFLERLGAGDDFAAWCVRYGAVLEDTEGWAHLLVSVEAKVWPDWRRKLPHATRRLHLAASMFRLGDLDAASEETLYLLTHLGRALLLRAGLFPLSRPEMPEQLESIGHPALARLIREFLRGDPDRRRVRQAIGYGKKLLVHLDRGWFEKQFQERERIRKLKAARRAAG